LLKGCRALRDDAVHLIRLPDLNEQRTTRFTDTATGEAVRPTCTVG